MEASIIISPLALANLLNMNNGTEQIFLPNTAPSQSSAPTQRIGANAPPPSTQVNLDNVQDFSHVCRLCATITELVMPIFSGEGLQNKLASKIKKHLPITVRERDELPLVVCYQCANTLLAWHELVKCCVQADLALHAKLSSNKRKTNPPNNVIVTSSASVQNEPQGKLYYTSVRNALTEFNLDEDDTDVEFVCQKCVEKPALSTTQTLAEHIRHDHSLDILNNGVRTYITNHVTFEQVLAEESDRETQSETKEKPQVVPASLHCPFCASVFSSATRLLYHLNRHVEVTMADGVVVCCDLVFNDKKLFIQHLQEAHVDKISEEPVCVSCGFTTDTIDELKQHYKDAHSDVKSTKEKKVESPNNQKYIPAVCPECNKTFSNKYNMFAHMRSHSRAAVYPCDKCTRTYSNRGNLTQHQKLAHQGILKYICAECGDAFPRRSERDSHARLHSGATPHGCAHCGKAYRTKNTLTKHLEIHAGIRKYECEICSNKFRRKSHLDYHVKTHMKAVIPDEETVHEDDKTKVDIIEKPEFTISENGKRYAMCGVCRKSVSVGGWTRHVRAHRGERRHSCHACGLAFNDAGNLARHVRAIHSKQRPHTCPTCSKTFSRKSHLEDHVKSHSESRTFVCDICGKGSKSSAALRMHARTHDACRFPCVQCGARFKRRGELSAHMSVHTGEKAHICYCGKTFRLRSQLTTHSRVHQKTQEQDMDDLTSAGNVLGLHEVEEIQ